MSPYVEPGGSWRPFWLVAGALGVFVVLELVSPGIDLPGPVWAAALGTVLGIVGTGTVQARRIWTVRVDARGPDAALTVGGERVALSDVDAGHLRAVDAGVDAGAPVLGGGWSLPRGRTGLPLRLTDGRTVLVPTRDPSALHTALLAAVGDAPDGPPGTQGTLGS